MYKQFGDDDVVSDDVGETIQDAHGHPRQRRVPSADSLADCDITVRAPRTPIRSYITLGVLVFINLLNYMDRYTLASVLAQVQKWFSIHDKAASLLNTVFVCSYMVFAPLFGYLGDRFSRKYVMAIGILVWVGTTLAGSFIGRDGYWWFFMIRGFVGIGEASYSTIAPTIIADLFVGDRRTAALTCFYFAIPCGSGLGYIVGSAVANWFGAWYWALRVTPVLGLVCVIMCIFVIHEPKRGAIEQTDSRALQDLSASMVHPTGSYLEDVSALFKVKSFIWSTLGSTAIAFVVGTLAFWGPRFLIAARGSVGDTSVSKASLSFDFGIVTVVSGVLGVLGGSQLARIWRKTNKQADPLVCGFGVLFSAPFLFISLWQSNQILMVTWVLIAIGEILMFFNWTPNADILLYVIPPQRRSTAEAIQILILHLFGDATGPFIIGSISDSIRGAGTSHADYYVGYLYALYITPFVCVLGAVFYILAARYVVQDREKAEEEAKEMDKDSSVSQLDSFPGAPTHPDRPDERLDDDIENEAEPPIETSENIPSHVRFDEPGLSQPPRRQSPPKRLVDLAGMGNPQFIDI